MEYAKNTIVFCFFPPIIPPDFIDKVIIPVSSFTSMTVPLILTGPFAPTAIITPTCLFNSSWNL